MISLVELLKNLGQLFQVSMRATAWKNRQKLFFGKDSGKGTINEEFSTELTITTISSLQSSFELNFRVFNFHCQINLVILVMVMRVTSKMLNEESASGHSSLRYKSRYTMLVLINCFLL